jgi:hypothetical protein
MLATFAGTVQADDPSVLNTTEAPQEDGTRKKTKAVKRKAIPQEASKNRERLSLTICVQRLVFIVTSFADLREFIFS